MTSGEISTIEFYGFAVNWAKKEETMIHRVLGMVCRFFAGVNSGKECRAISSIYAKIIGLISADFFC